MKCGKCGAENVDTNAFCDNCGAYLEDTVTGENTGEKKETVKKKPPKKKKNKLPEKNGGYKREKATSRAERLAKARAWRAAMHLDP